MVVKKNILVYVAIALIILITAFGGVVAYYYRNPGLLLPVVQKYVFDSTGLSLSFEDLSFTMNPLRVVSSGITLERENAPGDFLMKIRNLDATAAMEGLFGQKILVFRNFEVTGFSILISGEWEMPEISRRTGRSSFLSGIIKGALAFFFFRDVRLEDLRLSEGNIIASGDKKIEISGIKADLNTRHLLEISCKALFEWQSEGIGFKAPQLGMVTATAVSLADPEIKGALYIKDAVIEGPCLNIGDMDMEARVVFNHRLKDARFDSLNVCFGGLDIESRSGEKTLIENLLLKTTARLSLKEERVDIYGFSLEVNETFNSSGKLEARLGPQKEITLTVDSCVLVPDKIINLLPRNIRNNLAPFTLSGPVGLKGEMGIREDVGVAIRCNLEISLDNNAYSILYDNLSLDGFASGEIKAQGIFPDIGIAARLKTGRTLFKGMGMTTGPFETTVSLYGGFPGFEIPEIKTHIPRFSVSASGKDFIVDTVNIEARDIRIDRVANRFVFPEIRITSSLIKNLELGLELTDDRKKIRITGSGTDLINSAFALNLIPAGWEMAGSETLEIEAELEGKEKCLFTALLDFDGLKMENSGSGFIVENLGFKTGINGAIDLHTSVITAKANTETSEGEILYDRFYLDLLNNPVSSSGAFHLDLSKHAFEFHQLELIFRDLFSLKARGSLKYQTEDKGIRLALHLSDTDIEPLFKNFISEPFKAEKPFLKTLDIGGRISGDIEINNLRNQWEAKGHLFLKNTDIRMSGDGYSTKGINLDLPFWYRAENIGVERSLEGSLSIETISVPLLPEQPFTAAIHVTPNNVEIGPENDLLIQGGKIGLGEITGTAIFSTRPLFRTRIELKDIGIQPLLSGYILRPVDGYINGTLDPVILNQGTVSSKGEIKATPFSGEAIISNPGIIGLWSPFPVISFNSRWKDLDLDQMTSGTSFGRIQGILEGSLNDFQFAYGQPQRFDLLMETVENKGVPQRISVRAIDNIAKIGGGHTPFMGLAGTFASFFKEFPYKKIGIHASLENDVFRVNGTMKEDNHEYIIKRSGFSGVNVVNQNPDNRISFKDMLKRIKRVTSSEGGPVIR
ncbi:MAG: hypothetical protein JW882_03065 [Deltaproteobacteria bacterium]|nr:hypothetical protein [Deltaproteobacteria bacterium]